jgi:hypothetical protein
VSALPDRQPGRKLGIRSKPILKLSIGEKAEKGYPTKIDHFRVVPGEGVAAAAGRKFTERYGDAPKSIEILLPPTLGKALTINYRAFAGGGSDEGGVLRAIGETNFAHEDYAGGPDTLTVFHQDGRVEHVEITGLDDPIAIELGVDLYTTFRFGIPTVLGYGSDAEIVTKGKESTDNLWQACHAIYGLFGSRAQIAVRPQLVVKPSKARPAVKVRETGEIRRITSRIYVLDLVIPESVDEMIGRLSERAAVLDAAGGPATVMYGSAPRAITAGGTPNYGEVEILDRDDSDGPEWPDDEPAASAADAGPQQPAGGMSTLPADPDAVTAASDPSETGTVPPAANGGDGSDNEPEPIIGQQAAVPTAEEIAAIAAAGATLIPSGPNEGKPLSEADETWIRYALGRHDFDAIRPRLEVWAAARFPDTYAKYQARKAA